MPRAFTRGQTQILFRHTPESIFDHDDFGLCRVTSVDLDPLDSGALNESALYDTIAEMASQWPENFRANFPEMRDPARRGRHFRIGAPRTVNFVPFPENVQCQKCGYVTDYDTARRRGSREARCPRQGCGGTMKQLRYVQAHNCGRLQPLYLPKSRKCKRCGGQEMRLYDPGRTPLAKWVCLNPKCNTPLQGLQQTPCECAYTEHSRTIPGRNPSDQKMRVYPVAEPGLYNPLIATFINFQQRAEQRLAQIEGAEALLLARTWDILDDRVLNVAQQRADFEAHSGSSTTDEIVEALRAVVPDHPKVLEHDARKANPPGQAAIDEVQHHLGPLSGGVPGRKLIEHVTLRDNVRLTSPKDVATQLCRRGQTAQAERFLSDSQDALTRLGFARAQAVEDFPIAQAAFGFTRVTKKPEASMINPFPADPSDHRSPIFALPTETEALWFQLDPLRVASWLADNHLIHSAAPTDPVAAWAWLWRGALKTPRREDGTLHPVSAAVQTLIHTVSHVMAQRMEWSGYAVSSIGEYLLPESLSFVLYANRYTENKIGGLLTLFEQRLPLWLHEAAQQGRDCIYDPICSHDGGSCAGCLHREFNCTHFNGLLSRATLYGGPLPDGQDFGTRAITHGYWQGALLTPGDET